MIRDASSIIEQGSSAVIALAFLLVLAWMMSVFSRELRKLTRAIDVNSTVLISVQQQVLVHDMTTHGIDTTAENHDQSNAIAITKLNEVLRQMKDLRQSIINGSHHAGP